MRHFVLVCFLCFVHSTRCASNEQHFQALKLKIERGDYQHVWNLLPEAYQNKSISLEEKLWLQARILLDQGAHFLALKILDSLEVQIKYTAVKRWGEELLTLRADVHYQLAEFDLYLNQIELLEKWRIHFYPHDSLRIAMNHTYRAKYFSAMIKPDSGRYNTCRALEIYWNNRETITELPIYQIYLTHVSCLRNSMGFPFDAGLKSIQAYSDTCLTLLNRRFPNTCVPKLRAMHSLAIPYFDQAAGIETWKNPTPLALQCYKEFRNRVFLLMKEYKKLAGHRYPYVSQIELFLGLLEVYRNDNKSAITHFVNAKNANTSMQTSLPMYTLSWRWMLGVLKYLPRLKYNEAHQVSKIQSLLDYRKELMEAEEIFFIRYFYNQAMNRNKEDDVYELCPFAELSWVNLQLFNHTNHAEYLARAWNYIQKDRYLDILKNKYLPESKFFTQKNTSVLSREIGLFKLKNDSLMLAENEFASFSKLSKSKLASEIYLSYVALKRHLRKFNFPDPFSANYLTGQFTYSIKALQQNLTQKKSAWISVSHFAEEKATKTFLWVICPDTCWVKEYTWRGREALLLPKLQGKLINYDSDSIDIHSHQIYRNIFKSSAEALRKRGIQRLYYCDDPSRPLGNPELWATDLNPKKPRYLINDFSITFQLLVLPDHLLRNRESSSSKSNIYTVCPKLGEQHINLSLARAYSDSISNVLGGKSFNQPVKKGDFLRVLSNAQIVQLFSHGEGEKGLVFSDGNLLPEEVRGLKIDADLVSLAACESSNGKLIKGEGVKGMTEALINAGAKRVISSNWKIDEKTTSRILLDFYRNLSVGMRADSSLRLAKIKYLSEAVNTENSPSFWGGLVLYGNPEAIAIFNRTFSFVSPITLVLVMSCVFFLLFFVEYQFRSGLIRMLKRFQNLF
jgi:hypothetical protein